MTRRQGITNRSKAKSQNARKRGPTPGFPAKSNTLSRQLLPISQADLHSSRTTSCATSSSKGVGTKATPVLGAEPSAALRDQLLKEINNLTDGDDLALWAHRRIAAKNTLTPNDALAIEAAYRALLEAPGSDLQDQAKTAALAEPGLAENQDTPVSERAVAEQQPSTAVMVSPTRLRPTCARFE